jgi:hypothetical protein
MEEEPAQEKIRDGRKTGPGDEKRWKKNRPRRRDEMEEEPAQEKRRDGRITGPGEEQRWKKNKPRRRAEMEEEQAQKKFYTKLIEPL